MKRIAIAGAPRTGKTTFAALLDAEGRGKHVYHTDAVKDEGWSEASLIAARWLDDVEGSIILEGVRVPYVLRKWLTIHQYDEKKPVDIVYILDEPKATQTPKQKSLGKGAQTVMDAILQRLIDRGVEIYYGLPKKGTPL